MTEHTDPTRTFPLVTTAAEYFLNGQFQRDLEAYAVISTGYADLDSVRPLSPGLYCLGECPETDATDFCSQMADQVAASGRPALYFSLRHATSELYRRSLARASCREEGIRPVIRDDVPMTVEDIVGTIDDFTGRSGTKPLVVIDGLPLVAPSPGYEIDPKTATDHIARSLKAVQNRQALAMILVLPLEDGDCPDPVDIGSFEGHGGLEYLADVLWGLQASEAAAEDTARRVVLTCAKDRYYAPDYSVAFLYHAGRCFFQPAPDPKDPET